MSIGAKEGILPGSRPSSPLTSPVWHRDGKQELRLTASPGPADGPSTPAPYGVRQLFTAHDVAEDKVDDRIKPPRNRTKFLDSGYAYRDCTGTVALEAIQISEIWPSVVESAEQVLATANGPETAPDISAPNSDHPTEAA